MNPLLVDWHVDINVPGEHTLTGINLLVEYSVSHDRLVVVKVRFLQ